MISGDTAPPDRGAESGKAAIFSSMRSGTPPDSPPEEMAEIPPGSSPLSVDLAKIAAKAHPRLLVTYHRIYHMEIQDNTRDVEAEMARRNTAILQEIRDAGYEGAVVNGQDLDVF